MANYKKVEITEFWFKLSSSGIYPHSDGLASQAAQAHSGPAILTLRCFFLVGLLGLAEEDGPPPGWGMVLTSVHSANDRLESTLPVLTSHGHGKTRPT